jgi:hypothetical protein
LLGWRESICQTQLHFWPSHPMLPPPPPPSPLPPPPPPQPPQVLQQEIHYSPNHAKGVAQRALRHAKRYKVPESPLLQVGRWVVYVTCLLPMLPQNSSCNQLPACPPHPCPPPAPLVARGV